MTRDIKLVVNGIERTATVEPRLLLVHFLREHLGQTFFAAIPTQEFLLAFSTTNDEILSKVRQQIAADYSRAKNPISPKLFLVTPDGITGDPTEREAWDW